MLGCQILSPHRLDFLDVSAEFVVEKHEFDLSVKEIQNHHLLAIRQADFLWLHLPNGYVGTSTSFEIGYALASKIPMFSNTTPNDETLSHFVTIVPSAYIAIERILFAGEEG
jgi:nucleoside 2-deoxyribosyltransferase